MGEEIQTADSYANFIFNEWRDVLVLSQRVKTYIFTAYDYSQDTGDIEYECYNLDSNEKDILYEYFSKLTSLYSALYPKVMARSDFGIFVKEYNEFKKYYEKPWTIQKTFVSPNGFEEINGLEAVVGKALEKLKILAFEEGV